jgi:predicted nuclease of restriction endonuclease-like (RecB) superfamily
MPAKKKTTITKLSPATRRKPRSATKADGRLNFTALVVAIQRIHEQSAAAVSRTVNATLTVRNWFIGNYIVEYEMHGADRAKYGEHLIPTLAKELALRKISRCDRRELFRYQRFYRAYPQIAETLSPQLIERLKVSSIVRSPIGQSDAVAGFPIMETVSPQLEIPGKKLLDSLSFSHFAEIIEIDDPLKRAFYEIECIRGNWSVRALKRQIATLYFERSGLSKEKEKLAAMVQKGVETTEPKLTIRDPYIFEFLGLRAKDAVAESDLEAALVENLREFLLELGHGFCLEAQQKSIVIGRTRGFVDLVFYHRILKCHVLVELKVDEFKHEHLGQINTYVTWYRQHMMAEGDNPPVGLLLCTGKDHALVQYAIAGMDNRLFVSKYAVELPSREELEKFLHARHLEMLGND